MLLDCILANSDYFYWWLEGLEEFILLFETQTTPLACWGTTLCEEEDYLPLTFELGRLEYAALTRH